MRDATVKYADGREEEYREALSIRYQGGFALLEGKGMTVAIPADKIEYIESWESL